MSARCLRSVVGSASVVGDIGGSTPDLEKGDLMNALIRALDHLAVRYLRYSIAKKHSSIQFPNNLEYVSRAIWHWQDCFEQNDNNDERSWAQWFEPNGHQQISS